MNVTSRYPFCTLRSPPPPTDSRNVEINGKIHRSDKSKNITRTCGIPAEYSARSQSKHTTYSSHRTKYTMACEPTHCGGWRSDNSVLYISMIPATFDTLIISNDWFSFRFLLCSALVPVLLLLQNLVIIQFYRTQKRKCRNVKEKQQYGNFSLFDYNGMFELIFRVRVRWTVLAVFRGGAGLVLDIHAIG